MAIKVKCSNCQSGFSAPDTTAGKKLKCPKCGSPIEIPALSADAVPRSASPQAEDRAQKVIVQVQVPSGTTMIGPVQKSLLVVWLLQVVMPGLAYFYIGQTGKGIIAVCVYLFLLVPLVVFTCGIGLIVAFPWGILVLIDSLVLASRMKREAISQWRCF